LLSKRNLPPYTEAVLTEIEELLDAVSVAGDSARPRVREIGCLGYCNQAPNAAVADRGTRRLEGSDVVRKIRSLEASAEVVYRATGKRPSTTDPAARERFARLRDARARRRAATESKWNAALRGFAEAASRSPDTLGAEFVELLSKAGFPGGNGLGGGDDVSMPAAVANYSPWWGGAG
jgi:hypothetical protein